MVTRAARRPAGDVGTRERLIQAALDVFASRGYHGTTVDDIVAASRTSKGAFYHYFPSKQGIFLELLDQLAGMMEAGVEAAIAAEHGALPKVEAALRVVLEVASAHRELARILLIEAAALGPEFEQSRLGIHRRFAGLIQRHLERAVVEGAIPPQDTRVTAMAWIGAINEVLTQELAAGRDLLAALPALRTVLLRSIGAPVVERGGAEGASGDTGGAGGGVNRASGGAEGRIGDVDRASGGADGASGDVTDDDTLEHRSVPEGSGPGAAQGRDVARGRGVS
ncbi:MAG: TetR/AcrR family transcriptional regulator [Armatimonadota bacterium]|nr:TetR/AcrR family transcriptional regulator [Armatimonadota bacterium]